MYKEVSEDGREYNIIINNAYCCRDYYRGIKTYGSKRLHQNSTCRGPVEEEYLKNGEFSVKVIEINGSEITKKFYLYYPENLESENRKYPIAVMLNGTGVLPKKYESVFLHLASHGFVVIGNDDDSSGFGESADETIELILKENEDKDSIFCGKLDEENIGIMGHSQGGAGVFTAISVMKYKNMYKTAISLSPTQEELSHQLGWNYDLSKITIPVLMLAGTIGDFEVQAVIPLDKMRNMYEKIPSVKVMARRVGAEHGEMLYSADGYTTAWLAYYLKNDTTAKGLFEEIQENKLYQDQVINGVAW